MKLMKDQNGKYHHIINEDEFNEFHPDIFLRRATKDETNKYFEVKTGD